MTDIFAQEPCFINTEVEFVSPPLEVSPVEHDTAYYLDILNELDNLDTDLTSKEVDFVENMLRLADRYGDELVISVKRRAWLDDLRVKYLV